MKVICQICKTEFEYDPYWDDNRVFVGGRKAQYICPECKKIGDEYADSATHERKYKLFMSMSNNDDIRR